MLRHLRSQNWLSYALDLVVVVLGVFLAFQLDRWYDGERDRQLERSYLTRLRGEFEQEIRLFDESRDRATRRLDVVSYLEQVAADPSLAATEPRRFVEALEKASWTSFPVVSRFVYRELQNSGRFTLLESEELRRAIVEHYGDLDHWERLVRDRHLQLAFERETVGILDSQQLALVDDDRTDELEITGEEAVRLAQQLRQRPAAVALLPELFQHHTLNLRVIQQASGRTEALVRLIDRQQDD